MLLTVGTGTLGGAPNRQSIDVTTSDDRVDGVAETLPPGEPADSVATGIIAAERRAQERIARRRRILVGSAVLGLVLVGAVLAVMTVLQQQANTEAELASDRAEARAAFATDVVDQVEDYEPPARAVDDDADGLRRTLEQFLTETETSDHVLATEVDTSVARLGAAASSIAELTARDIPAPPELIDSNRAVEVLRAMETLRVEADALAAEVPLAINDAEQWLGHVRDVNDAVSAHVAQVEGEEATSDPRELIDLWRAERPALLRLSAAATAADGVPGLGSWGQAHQQYAEDLLAWIEEALLLLQDGDLEAYNDRFEELFDTDDPFGFDAAVAAATGDALESPALLQLGTLQQRAQLVLDAIETTEVTAAEQLGDDTPPVG